MNDIIIIGGGIAGLINAIQLADAGLDVLVIEKKIVSVPSCMRGIYLE